MDGQTEYIESHSSAVCKTLDWLEKQTNLRTNYPQMLCGRQKGRLLKLLASLSGGQRILEIGTFTGYSAICLASGLNKGGRLDALEINDELEDLINEAWNMSGLADRIELHVCDALDWMEKEAARSKGIYDLIFIDANKREYPSYYEKSIDLVRPGGLIVADDVLMGGKVWCDEAHDAQTSALRSFNDILASDDRVEVMILPLHDGVSIARKIR